MVLEVDIHAAGGHYVLPHCIIFYHLASAVWKILVISGEETASRITEVEVIAWPLRYGWHPTLHGIQPYMESVLLLDY